MSFVRKTLRFLRKTLLVLLFIVLALLVFVLAGGLGPTVKYVGAPLAKMFGLDVRVERCVILPLGGYVLVEGLRVENPRRFAEEKPNLYRDDPLVGLGTLELDVGMRSLLSKEYVVDTLRVEGLRALYAFDLGTTNVDALMAQMGLTGESADEAIADAEEKGREAQEDAAEPAAEREDIRFRVGYLHFEDNMVTVRKYVPITLPLPPITLHDVDNASLKARVDATLAPVYKTIRGLGEGLGAATDALGDGAKAAGAALGDGATAVKDLLGDGANLTGEGISKGVEGLKDSLKGAGDGAKETLDGLKDLFKKK